MALSERSAYVSAGAAERAFAVLALLLMLEAFVPMITGARLADPAAGPDTPGSFRFQIVAAGLYAVCLGLLFLRLGRLMEIVGRSSILWLLIIYAALSFFWSANPELTLRRVAALAGTTIVALYLVSAFSEKQLLQLLAWAFAIAAVSSLATALLLPEWGTHIGKHDGAWRGVFGHKNELGRLMALGAVLFLLTASLYPRQRWICYAATGLALLLVVYSTSRQAWVTAAGLLLLYLILQRLLRFDLSLLLLVALAALIGISGLTLYAEPLAEAVLGAMGRDLTLTGRTNLWAAAISVGAEQPLFGHGYRAFWTDSLRAQVQSLSGHNVGHGHNGYLDLWLELGYCGVFLFILTLVFFMWNAVKYLYSLRNISALWHIIFILYMLIVSFAATVVLSQNNITWVLYVASFCLLSRHSADQRFHRR